MLSQSLAGSETGDPVGSVALVETGAQPPDFLLRAGGPLREVESTVSESSTKQRVVEAVRQLPENATVEEAMERLYFLAKVERGMRDAETGRTVSHEEIRQRFLK